MSTSLSPCPGLGSKFRTVAVLGLLITLIGVGCGRTTEVEREVELKPNEAARPRSASSVVRVEHKTPQVSPPTEEQPTSGESSGSPSAPDRKGAHPFRDSPSGEVLPSSPGADQTKLVSALKERVQAREGNLAEWEAELKGRQIRLSAAWKELGIPSRFQSNTPIKEIDAKLDEAKGGALSKVKSPILEADPELAAIEDKIFALDAAEAKLGVWEKLLKEDEDRCVAAAKALILSGDDEQQPPQNQSANADDGAPLVVPKPNSQRDYRRLVSNGLIGQMMPHAQRIPKGMRINCKFAQTVDAGKLNEGSKFYILANSGSDSDPGGFGPAHEFANFPKGTYFEASVFEVKRDVEGLDAGKGGAVFKILRVVMPRRDSNGRETELCIDVAATMGKEAPSALLYDQEAARTRASGVAANAMQLLDHGSGFFNGQAGVEMTMRGWEHFVSKPQEKARSCFLFGTVKKGTDCQIDLLADSWF